MPLSLGYEVTVEKTRRPFGDVPRKACLRRDQVMGMMVVAVLMIPPGTRD
jgi:hypothetical protein